MKTIKLMLCEGIKPANDWQNAVSLSNTEIRELLLWLKRQIPSEFQGNTTSPQMEDDSLEDRAKYCYKFALQNLSAHKYGNAIHEIHDFIYGYGQNLDVPMSSLEWVMISCLVDEGLKVITD